jgi:hypothetical protein
MPKLPGINHLRAVKSLEKAGFQIDRQGKHMSKGATKVVIPRNNPVDAYTMAAIGRDAGLPLSNLKSFFERRTSTTSSRITTLFSEEKAPASGWQKGDELRRRMAEAIRERRKSGNRLAGCAGVVP